ncbi:MAG: hypothetical protein WBD31_26860 [Rubripirellula sp.]
MPKIGLLAIAVFIFFVAVARLSITSIHSLDAFSIQADPPISWRPDDIRQIEKQTFDPNALVLITPGPDRLPGQAGKDDDLNGVVDNVGEMGAVGSDDLCLAPWNDGYDDAAEQPDSITIGRGAYVPAGSVTPAEVREWENGDRPDGVRYLIMTRTGNKPRSRLLMDRQR